MAELAPSDLAAWRAASRQARVAAMAGWDGPALDKESRQLLARLYQKADGDYVREQVRIFNGERRLLAWRVRALPAGAQWRAAAAGAPVTLGATMPAGAGRLFQRLPQGWGPWQRVAQWPGAETAPLAALTLQLARPAATGETLDMIVAGSLAQVDGARLRMREDACTGHGCPAPDAVQRLVLDLLPGVHSVTLHAAPLDASPLTDAKYRHLAAVGGRLEWQDVPKGDVSALPAAAGVRLADRNGTELWGEGGATAQAAAAGLAPLLGLHPGHANSVAGMLARLPSLDGRPHAARLTLDLPLQAAAQAALECAGMRRGAWDGQTCTGGAAPPPARQAGLVLLDTDDGEILAAAGAGMPPVDESNWAEVLDFDRANPAASPLRLPALQHDGGGERSPGSTFKIISSLGLELAAQGDPQLDALLGGMRLSAMDSLAREKGFAFRTDSATYPADGRPAHITNFGETGLVRHAQDGRLGLVQALTYSLNSWFAWTSELSDRSLFGRPEGGVPDLQGLEPNALAAVRPIVAMAQRLGFERPLRLDGGLLPANYPWSPWDALRTTPAHIDPVHSRNELRMMAIGLRMQATPLQMALAAGAVGQGWVVQPRLLLDLDGRAAARVAGPTLGVRLDRIRAGMKGVVDRGTGSSAFRGARFDSLRPGLYGKTGTAPISEVDENGKGLASVWFAGWLEPGSLPGQTHRLAFAAFVSRSTGTGGADAAPVVAALLRSLAQRQASPPGQ
jgi:cell division protein FtsI/penicillin-binding protein 2